MRLSMDRRAGFGVYRLEKLEELLAGAQKGTEVPLQPEQVVELGEQVVVRRLFSLTLLPWAL